MIRIKHLFMVTAVILVFTGCRQVPGPAAAAPGIDRQIEGLILDTLASCRFRRPDIAPAAVVSARRAKSRSSTT